MRGLLDTSIFIAGGQERPLASARLPDHAAVSVVSLAELELGVQLADTETIRARRLRTLRAVQSTYVALPVDQSVASAFAELVAAARRAGRRPKVQDAWIAATAHAHSVPVYSQDDHFDDFPVDVVLV
ncbi:MAG: PIN domain-containing protein [Solirubrobacteraceae bacterium]